MIILLTVNRYRSKVEGYSEVTQWPSNRKKSRLFVEW